MRLLITEWNGQLYTPYGTLSQFTTTQGGAFSVAPVTQGLYDLNKTGEIWDSRVVDEPTPADAFIQMMEVREGTVRVGGEETYRWPVGFTGILGPAGSGKTRMARPFAALFANNRLVRFGEPGPDTGQYHPQLFNGLLNACFEKPGVVHVIDSMRMATMGGGQLGPGGIPRDMGGQLSAVDYAARMAGVAVFGVINLLTTDEKAEASAIEVLQGSITGLIQTDDYKNDTVTGLVMLRPKTRRPAAFSFKFPSYNDFNR